MIQHEVSLCKSLQSVLLVYDLFHRQLNIVLCILNHDGPVSSISYENRFQNFLFLGPHDWFEISRTRLANESVEKNSLVRADTSLVKGYLPSELIQVQDALTYLIFWNEMK